MRRRNDADTGAALTPAVFHVLLALSEEARHGYAIMMAVRDTAGMSMGPGTIYGTLQRLEEAGLVEEAGARGESDAERRRYYALTAAGRMALRAEASRIHGLAELLSARNLSPRASEGR